MIIPDKNNIYLIDTSTRERKSTVPLQRQPSPVSCSGYERSADVKRVSLASPAVPSGADGRRACLKAHISTSSYFVVSGNARYVSVGRKLLPSAVRLSGGGGRRNEITEWSKGSQMRFRKKCHEIPEDEIAKDEQFFITLTYDPRCYPEKPGVAIKKHLNHFGVCLRRFGIEYDVPFQAIWFREFQLNGRAHFHLFFRAVWRGSFSTHTKFIHFMRSWVASTWHKIIGSSEFGLRAGTQFDAVKVSGIRYLLKYVGKSEQKKLPDGFDDAGRWWGVWNWGDIEKLPSVCFSVSLELYILVRRCLRSLLRSRGCKRKYSNLFRGFPVFGVSVFEILRLLDFYDSQRGTCSYLEVMS